MTYFNRLSLYGCALALACLHNAFACMAAPPTVRAVASPSAEESAAADSPVMGWSSWNTYHVNISDTLIMRQADAMVAKGLKAAGYRYINIDDGFFGYRDSTGLMHAHPQRFPRGLRPVADYIHSLGFKAGIYSDAGSHTCGSRYDNDENGFWAGLYGHERQDAELYFNDWGFDFIKIDYCGAGTELNLDERRRYTEISEAFKSVGCGDVEINICRWAFPGTWARSIVRSWRISPDIRPRWSSVKRIIDLNLYLSAYCGGGHYNDMDMLEIGRGMPRNEEEVHFGMWCIMSSPLMIGCDMQTIPEASLSLIKNEELIALNQDPLGLQAYVVQHEGEGYVLTKDIGRRRGTERAVALYNPSDSACHFNVPLSLLELGGRVRLRDLVRRCDLEPVSDSIVCDLPARSLRLLRAEGLYRTDPVAYEAEWAYLPCFDALGKVKHQVLYAANPDASGGMVVSWLGGRKENIARWSDVYSSRGGAYDMTITYVPAARRRLEVTVNGTTTRLYDLDSEGRLATVTIPVTLRKGFNTVEMGYPYGWTVDIDRFELCPAGSGGR